MYRQMSRGDWSLEKCGVSKKPSETVSKWELEALTCHSQQCKVQHQEEPSSALAGVRHSCPYSKPHPALGLVPRFLNTTKCSSFHDVHFLTFMKPLTSSHCLQVVLLYASTYVLVSLSIDRYHAIVYPMKFLQGGKQAQTKYYPWVRVFANIILSNGSFPSPFPLLPLPSPLLESDCRKRRKETWLPGKMLTVGLDGQGKMLCWAHSVTISLDTNASSFFFFSE